MKTNKTITVVLILAAMVAAIFLAENNSNKNSSPQDSPNDTSLPANEGALKTFTENMLGITFSYPEKWGDVYPSPDIGLCPEDDHYRTADTLIVYDGEYKFPRLDLANSESYVLTGLRMYQINPDVSNDCNDDLLRKLATGEIKGDEISSVRLQRVSIPGFHGVLNEQASRLNTSGRVQYTWFSKIENSTDYLVLQPYIDFVPYSESPEWIEMETSFSGDMEAYLASGITAEPIRQRIQELKTFAESIRKTEN
ncbi:MAG TPA: hypothetical protein VFQ59_00185 [Candidatus Paceibacterota bacterium]|nr:hypothetical protein [Candidatus Paceibacterota bacterium]